jgi:hypothetical protein
MLEWGRVYIVEDIETSYWLRLILYDYPITYGYKQKNNFLKAVKALADGVNFEFLNE